MFAQYLTTRFRVNNDLFTYQSNIQDKIIQQCNGVSSAECFARIRVGSPLHATTMAIFLRATGIPARVVNGFPAASASKAGVETITNSQSHEWSRGLLPGYGWVMSSTSTGGDLAPRGPYRRATGPVRFGSDRLRPFLLPPSFGDGRDDTTPNVSGFGSGGTVAAAGPYIATAVLLAIIAIAPRVRRLGSAGRERGTTADHAYRNGDRGSRRGSASAPRPTQTVYEPAGLPRRGPAERRAPELETVARAEVEIRSAPATILGDRSPARPARCRRPPVAGRASSGPRSAAGNADRRH